MMVAAVGSAAISGYAGLVAAHHAGLPAGPAIVLAAGALYMLSVIAGPVGGLIWSILPRRHLKA
jgi:zinc/manganese transport system permease protein